MGSKLSQPEPEPCFLTPDPALFLKDNLSILKALKNPEDRPYAWDRPGSRDPTALWEFWESPYSYKMQIALFSKPTASLMHQFIQSGSFPKVGHLWLQEPLPMQGDGWGWSLAQVLHLLLSKPPQSPPPPFLALFRLKIYCILEIKQLVKQNPVLKTIFLNNTCFKKMTTIVKENVFDDGHETNETTELV